jgi:cysteine desulfurase
MKKIYLDHSATTPLDKNVLKAMGPYFTEKFGNPSSLHSYGQEALAGIEKARRQTAEFLNCSPDEIIFTSGATESDNLAIKGLVRALKKKMPKPHIITSLIEHKAILEPCLELEKEGAEATYLGVNKSGAVSVEDLRAKIKDNTVLVSIMYINSEVGCAEPIREIGKVIKKINEKKFKEWNNKKASERGERPQKIYFHTDATQAVNFFNCDVKWNYLDLLSLSGHKIYGPKGVGALYLNKEVPFKAMQVGGGHEQNRRSGTLNAPGIVGLGAALSQLTKKSTERNNKKIARLRDLLVQGIMENIDDVILNTDRNIATPAHAHFSFLGVEGEAILISLDLAGIAVSTGSACASGNLKPSHVLLAMGIKPEVAHNSIRFTLGKQTTEEEIRRVIKILPPIIKRLRLMAPK